MIGRRQTLTTDSTRLIRADTMAPLSTLSFALILTVAIAIEGIYADEPEKLVNGTNTDIVEYPFAISMRYKGFHFCGGAIISDRHILTAAHCLETFIRNERMWKDIVVVTGTSSLLQGGEFHQIAEMHQHYGYVRNHGNRFGGFDVGIVTLDKQLMFNDYQKPVPLPTTDVPMRTFVKVVAWGAMSYPRGPLSAILQELQVITMDPQQCQKYHNEKVSVLTEFCTYLAQGAGVCEGDSGSPVIYEGTVVGVVSSAIPCARGIPDIQTNIYRVREFIDTVLSS